MNKSASFHPALFSVVWAKFLPASLFNFCQNYTLHAYSGTEKMMVFDYVYAGRSQTIKHATISVMPNIPQYKAINFYNSYFDTTLYISVCNLYWNPLLENCSS